jgi:hypothetical protein
MPTNRKLLGAAAFSLALAGGGAVGALLGTPSFSGAQDGAEATTEATADDVGPGRFEHRGEGLTAAAEAIGITEDELRTALQDGSSIADVAAANDVDVQTVIDALVADATAHIDEEVAEGDLTAEGAAARKADLVERITALVNGERPERPADQ